jgi:hypothetical protein
MMSSSNKSEGEQRITLKESYKTALDTRNFEISLFWQRSNYFLALNSALALGYFNLKEQEYSLILSSFGFIVSLLWFRVNLGSKFWQSRWEYRLSKIEKEIAPELHFFATDLPTVKHDVEISLGNEAHKKCYRRLLNYLVLRKPSVSRQMIWLSFLFMLGWIALWGKAIAPVVRSW